MSTLQYYDENAQDFFLSTINADLSELYAHFLPRLKANALILDTGCGSGRDSKVFLDKGFRVVANDASPKLAYSANQYTGLEIQVCDFHHIQTSISFDAIWACASLLHVAAIDLPSTFQVLAAQLVNNGIFYCSFKYGTSSGMRNGRYFTDANEAYLKEWLKNTPLIIDDTWITSDVRPGRETEKWLNAILVKVA